MVRKIVSNIGLLLAAATTLPLTNAQQGRIRVGDPPPNGAADLYVTPTPREIPRSLKDLCDRSILIIEGTVSTTLPSRETSPRALETDAVIRVDKVFKGQSDLREVVLSQRGGATGVLVVTPVQYSLVRPGGQYLLFLSEDSRPGIPQVQGLKRYFVFGAWAGLFPFENGHMHVDARQVDHLRKTYEGLTLAQIETEVSGLLAAKP